jgi:hypothetical protein
VAEGVEQSHPWRDAVQPGLYVIEHLIEHDGYFHEVTLEARQRLRGTACRGGKTEIRLDVG